MYIIFGQQCLAFQRIVLRALQQEKFRLDPNLNLVGALPRGADSCF